MVLLLKIGSCYEPEICAILLPLRYSFTWYPFFGRCQMFQFLAKKHGLLSGILTRNRGHSSGIPSPSRQLASRLSNWLLLLRVPPANSTQEKRESRMAWMTSALGYLEAKMLKVNQTLTKSAHERECTHCFLHFQDRIPPTPRVFSGTSDSADQPASVVSSLRYEEWPQS